MAGAQFSSVFSSLANSGDFPTAAGSSAPAFFTSNGNPFGGGSAPTATSGSSSGSSSNSGSSSGNGVSSGDGTAAPNLISASSSGGTPKHIVLAIVLPIAMVTAATIFFAAMFFYYRRKRALTPAQQQKADLEHPTAGSGGEKPTEYYHRDADPTDASLPASATEPSASGTALEPPVPIIIPRTPPPAYYQNHSPHSNDSQRPLAQLSQQSDDEDEDGGGGDDDDRVSAFSLDHEGTVRSEEEISVADGLYADGHRMRTIINL